MAQRNTPSRRIPGEPLAGILRTVAYQARYANRRRSDIPTVTNPAAASAAAAEAAAADAGVASLSGPATMAEAMTQVASERAYAELQQDAAVATFVAAADLPRNDAATLQADADGRAVWQYENRGSVPHVVATAVADQPATATVAERGETSATLRVWDALGQPVAGAFVCVAAFWP
ncbi:hypothetical protein SEA_MAIH_23 [Streptomyces phage Maih]|uniref:Uncharacterized protein n=5 Tax=Woodruffvirus TP1604 TaxID=1982746 RepID=A0A1P8VW15_9CAUD|nr:hypothetical protein AVT62_gp23 [Streptomyces phage TP1604]ALY07273.1 hypothetical protein SEA_MAIH_23 [Streptomyces phage Maih]APZ82191.1 hypothetical protein SEA_BABYGOTBAC_23 [Streptomyces phage BabyGotBac]AWN08383.1 hypothetical protein SEA_BAYC_23 [Streptomyces phage BayC]AWN08454.1 hypothetical protein SEA_SALETE_23 [Streptomyces phage Salete]USH45398.1 hypothetical protein SEA_ASIS_23 [Streptomyces phage Asis]